MTTGIQLCFQCGTFVDYDGGPACEHTESEATETDLDDTGIARTKLEAIADELERENPRVSPVTLQAEMASLAVKVPSVESDDPDGELTSGDVLDDLR